VVLRGPFAVHFLVVVEEVGVDFVEEPLLLGYGLLQEDKQTGTNPVDEGTGRPLMCEGQMEKLEHLEEGPEAIHKPVFIFFSNASLKQS
jgi:hypothetical protein